MQSFKINENLEVICQAKSTRNGFKHTASLMKDGRNIEEVKICYLNRTWERYEFESVMQKLLDKTLANGLLTLEEHVQFKETIKNGGEREMKRLKTIGLIAGLGDVFGKSKKEKNDWKKRMIEAGLGGLIMPDDWDSLSEDEKQERLDGAISQLNQ